MTGQTGISHMRGVDWMQKGTVMEGSMVGIQTLVSHYKYPCCHRLSAGREHKNIFFLCFSKYIRKNVGCLGAEDVIVYMLTYDCFVLFCMDREERNYGMHRTLWLVSFVHSYI